MNILKLTAAAAILGAAGLGAAAIAHPHPDGDGEGREIRRVIVLDGEGKERLKDVRKRLHGVDRVELLAMCEGAKTEIDEASGSEKKERTRIVICEKRDADPAVRAEQLEKALARVTENDELSAEHRERVATALREAISRMRETD